MLFAPFTLVVLAGPSFVNFETGLVHPVASSPDGSMLAVCNLPAARIEFFDIGTGVPVPAGHVPVGLDPVSLRFRSASEFWVVNHISRSISIVDVARRIVVDTIDTLDGPADIAFAGFPSRAFVSCAKANTVQVLDALTRQVITNVVIDGERPKAMGLSPDGSKLYVAVFESGNGSTVLVGAQPETRQVLLHPDGPYGGRMPVPNDGPNLRPPLNTNLHGFEMLLPDSLIVKKNSTGRWLDDNQGDWTQFVSGTNAALSGRVQGWDLPDRDLAVIDTATLTVTYVTGLMNICMDVAVNPASGRISVVGTDANNERRFEPNLRGVFLRVQLALVDPNTLNRSIIDLNPHLDYSASNVTASTRDLSIGDPRGIVWNSAGTRAYVTGMGSRNLMVLDANGQRIGSTPIELGEGPSGLVLDEPRQRLYVLNRFSATVSVVDSATLNVVTNVPFFDPTPAAIKVGRKHLYDTRRNSLFGHVSCASCHVDARFDRIAWDLGNPAADIAYYPGQGRTFHPMKGPLVTQTLQDIIEPPDEIRVKPLHWRGDRPDIESFNVTFIDLLGADAPLTAQEMQEFKNLLDTIHFPPNRFRNFDNSFPTNLVLPGFFGVDSNGVPDGTRLPNGNAVAGMDQFFTTDFDGRFELTQRESCTVCHNHQSGRGLEGDFVLFGREDTRPFKAAQLRSIAEKLGMDLSSTNSRAGFGFRFDGRADTLTLVLSDIFRIGDNQTLADLTALLLAFPGSDFPRHDAPFGFPDDSQDTHAAVGKQFTVRGPEGHPLLLQVIEMTGVEELPPIDLIARGLKDGLYRGWYYTNRFFQSDSQNEEHSLAELLGLATPDTPITFTVLPPGVGRRLGADRDDDGVFDRTEMDYGFDPENSNSRPDNHPPQWTSLLHPTILHPGMTIQQALAATDPDFPLQTLTFVLGSGAPSGVAVDLVTGLLEWTPTVEHADMNHYIRVRVMDDGMPPFSAVTGFYVPVMALRVELRHRKQDNTNVLTATSVHGTTIAGLKYRVQYKDRLEALTWIDIGAAMTSAGNPIEFLDPSTSDTMRFYRVVVE